MNTAMDTGRASTGEGATLCATTTSSSCKTRRTRRWTCPPPRSLQTSARNTIPCPRPPSLPTTPANFRPRSRSRTRKLSAVSIEHTSTLLLRTSHTTRLHTRRATLGAAVPLPVVMAMMPIPLIPPRPKLRSNFPRHQFPTSSNSPLAGHIASILLYSLRAILIPLALLPCRLGPWHTRLPLHRRLSRFRPTVLAPRRQVGKSRWHGVHPWPRFIVTRDTTTRYLHLR